ncbi:hypothetical protein NS07_v2contig00080-0002 [Nocardia seriolae]|nr:hypothetical protein NS07_v2contig00080-0002 [Nocardia seriolae]
MVRARPGDQRRPGRAGGIAERRQRGHRGPLEEVAHVHGDAQRLPDAGDGAGGDERVAADGEEVVVRADHREVEDVGEDARDHLLGGRGRGAEGGGGVGEDRFGQRFSIDLAVHVERQLGHRDQHRGHHVLGHVGADGGKHCGGVDLGVTGRHDVADQRLLAIGAGVHEHHRLGDRGIAAQRRLHLAEFDAQAAHLHLEVAAAHVLQLVGAAVAGHPAHQVAGAVHAITGRAFGIGHKPLGGQARAGDIAARELRSGDVQLADHADRHGTQILVQDQQFDVVAGHADRNRVDVGGGDLVGGGQHGGLGRAVHVEQGRAADAAEVSGGADGDGLATGEQIAQGIGHVLAAAQHLGHQRAQHGGHEKGRGDPGFAHDADQVGGVEVAVRGGDHQPGPGLQGPEDLPHRGVEGGGGLEQYGVLVGEPELPLLPAQEGHHRAVRDGHALGAAGGTGGEDDVGQVVRAGLRQLRVVGRGQHPIAVQAVFPCVALEFVDAQHRGVDVEVGLVAGGGEHDRGLGDLEHVGGALGRVVGVDGHVRAARLQDGVHADQQLERAPHRQAHQHVGADAQAAQVAGENRDAGDEFGVGEARALEFHGHRVGGAPHLLPELGDQGLDRGQLGVEDIGGGQDGIVDQRLQRRGQPALLPGHQAGQLAGDHDLHERLGLERAAHGLAQHLDRGGQRAVGDAVPRVAQGGSVGVQIGDNGDQTW